MRWTMDALTSGYLLYDAGKRGTGVRNMEKVMAEVMANAFLGSTIIVKCGRNGAKVKFKNRPTEYGA